MESTTGLRPLELVGHRCPVSEDFTLDIVKSFISFGADVNFQNGESLLHVMFSRFQGGGIALYTEEKFIPAIDLVAPHVENIDVKACDGESLLYQTVKHGLWDLAFALLQHGASLWEEDWFLKHENILDECEAVDSEEDIREVYRAHGHDDLPEGYVVKNEAFHSRKLTDLYDYFFQHQLTVQFMCRTSIRRHLKPPLRNSVQQLQIPRCFTEYLIKLK